MSKLVIWGTSWGRGFRCHWLLTLHCPGLQCDAFACTAGFLHHALLCCATRPVLYHVGPYLAMTCDCMSIVFLLSCHALPCHALPCLAMPCIALPCRAMPCHALPCLAMPCHALPCLAIPCNALPCHVRYCQARRLTNQGNLQFVGQFAKASGIGGAVI